METQTGRWKPEWLYKVRRACFQTEKIWNALEFHNFFSGYSCKHKEFVKVLLLFRQGPLPLQISVVTQSFKLWYSGTWHRAAWLPKFQKSILFRFSLPVVLQLTNYLPLRGHCCEERTSAIRTQWALQRCSSGAGPAITFPHASNTLIDLAVISMLIFLSLSTSNLVTPRSLS